MAKDTAMKTHRSLGPSDFDANEMRKLLALFKAPSTDLCKN